jgi:adenylate cyclase, class 2
METEIEAKWLNIDKHSFRKKLQSVGAKLTSPERKMVRQVFDYPDMHLEKDGGWVRVRDEAGKITMSYKQLNDRTLHGTKEVTLMVDNYDHARSFLYAIGLESNSIQETIRESWELNGAAIEIDTWPWIPSFVEVEAKSEEGLRRVAEILGLDFKDALHGSVETAYQAVYDVTEQEVDSWPEIRFSEVPGWLRAKQRKETK